VLSRTWNWTLKRLGTCAAWMQACFRSRCVCLFYVAVLLVCVYPHVRHALVVCTGCRYRYGPLLTCDGGGFLLFGLQRSTQILATLFCSTGKVRGVRVAAREVERGWGVLFSPACCCVQLRAHVGMKLREQGGSLRQLHTRLQGGCGGSC